MRRHAGAFLVSGIFLLAVAGCTFDLLPEGANVHLRIAQDHARTIDVTTLPMVDHYEATLTSGSQSRIVLDVEASPDIQLAPGLWTIEAKAYDAATGGNFVGELTTEVIIREGEMNTIALTLRPVSYSTGQFAVDLDWTEYADRVEFGLRPWSMADKDNPNVAALNTLTADPPNAIPGTSFLSEGTFTIALNNGSRSTAHFEATLNSGTYLLTLRVMNSTNTTLLIEEIVRVNDFAQSTKQLNPVHFVNFHANGGSFPPDPLAIRSGNTDTLSYSEMSRSGFVFVGWNTEAAGSGTAYGDQDDYTMGNSDVTLYAQWVPEHTVTYEGNGATAGAMSMKFVGQGNVFVLDTNLFSRTDFVFAGWNTVAGGAGNSYADGASLTMGTGNVVLYAQWDPIYTFTNAGATGRFGPSQGQVTAAYSGTALAGAVLSTTNNGTPGIQKWIVPVSGLYHVEAYGAQGAAFDNAWGRGAAVAGDISLVGGQILWILVGQQGEAGTGGLSNYGFGGGGGGTFVGTGGTLSGATPLLVAGGGGASGEIYGYDPRSNGDTSTSGQPGGNNNGDGVADNNDGGVAGGAGERGLKQSGYPNSTEIVMDAAAGWSGSGVSSQAFLAGGAGAEGDTSRLGVGGFGGGGSLYWSGLNNYSLAYAGGGGGYSGGGASDGANGSMFWGGGGGSFNIGANQVNSVGANTGMGKVIIYRVAP